jgi:FAD/FMN-containing dehydrogenase
VLPPDATNQGLRELLEELSRSRRASFLAVLKRFGAEGKGLLSFPQPGYTLALDLPLREGLFALLERLDEIVLGYGGRVYLAKNARVWAETFRAMYPRLHEWQKIKAQVDPANHFRSDLSAMLQL